MSQPISGDSQGQSDEPPEGSPESNADDDHPHPLAISLNLQTADLDPPMTGWLDIQLCKLVQMAGIKQMQLSIAIVDDARMSELHVQYMDISGTTDVLTFDLSDDPDDPSVIEGELILCIDEASRQAASRGHETRMELLLYALHGVLHLMGYDDHEDDDYDRIHACEDQLLTAAGFEALFAREEKPL